MPAMESTPRIIHLAAEIHQRAAELQNVLDAKGFPTPSFDEDSPTRLPDEASEAQDAILDAAAELYDLLLEPTTLILKNSAVSLESLEYGFPPSSETANNNFPPSCRTTTLAASASLPSSIFQGWCPWAAKCRLPRSPKGQALPKVSLLALCGTLCADTYSAKRRLVSFGTPRPRKPSASRGFSAF